MILCLTWALLHFTAISAKSFANGMEKIPARCQLFNPDLSSMSPHLDFEWDSWRRTEADDSYIRVGCPHSYKIFGEFHCVLVDHLQQFRTGAMTWSQLLSHRVNKASLEQLNRDQGRCDNYGPDHAPTVEFDDDHCVVLSVVCQYKFGALQFDWVLAHREEYPLKTHPFINAKAKPSIPDDVVLPPRRNCGVIDSYVEFDETHCVLRSALEEFIVDLRTWDQLLEHKVNKVYLGAATTTTPRPSLPRTEAELNILKLLAPLIGPYISNVVNNGRNQEIWFRNPPGMATRRNWKKLERTPFDHRGSHRLGFLADLQTRPKNVPTCRTPSAKRGRCKMLKDCFQAKFYTSLETFLDHSCSATRGVVGICCPLKASLNVSALSYKTLTPSKTREWEQLVASIDAQRIRLAPLTSTAAPPATLDQEEAQALAYLQPIVGHWIEAALIRIPHDVRYEMKKLKNWRTAHSKLRLDQLGLGFGAQHVEVTSLSCETPSAGRGLCRFVSQCLQSDLYESVDVFFNNSCPNGGSLGVCCPSHSPTSSTRPLVSSLATPQ